jgi:PKD domain
MIRLLAAIAPIAMSLLMTAPAAAHSGWLAPANLSAAGQDAIEPQVAVDGDGDAVAVWARSDGSHYIVQASARPAEGAWGPVADLSQSGRDSEAPQVAVDPAGDAVAVWAREIGAHWVIQGATKPAGAGWTPTRDISNSERTAKEPAVVIDPGGRAIAVWSRYDGFNNIIQSAEPAPGTASTWSEPVDLSKKGRDAEEPQVGVDAAGDAVAVWSRLEGTDMIAQAAFRPAGGGWGGAEDLSQPGGDATEPQVSVDPGGRAVAVWSRAVGGTGTVEAADMAPTGWWLEAVDLTGSGEDATEPDVALAGGRAVALWSLAGPGPYSTIQASEKPGGGAWQPSQDLTEMGLTQTVVTPQVAIDPNGNAAAVWARSGASPTVIEGRAKPAGAPWTGIFELSGLGSTAKEPQVALGATGDGASIWQRDDGVNTIIQAAGLDGAGPLFPSLSIPSAATVRQPVDFGAVTVDNWSPVTSVSWNFGDGAEGASGSRVSHTFARPGTYTISIAAADDLGNGRSAAGSITIYRQPNADRNVRVRHGVAFLTVHCPSPAGCSGVVRLIARVQLERNGRSFGKRAQIGRTAFSTPGGTSKIKVRLTRPGRAAVREGGRKGVRTQLTGPGIQHRLVLLLPARR